MRPEIGQYEVCTSAERLETSISAGQSEGILFGGIEALEPLDAFGAAGSYDRFALVRLYGGMRVRVVHGWRKLPDRFESVTLLSPYPDIALTRLSEGTMAIRFRIDREVLQAEAFR